MTNQLFAFTGIWADDSDNDVPEEKASKSSRSRRRGKGRNVDNSGSSGTKIKLGNANFSEPVSFVSGGIQQSGKKKNEQGDKNSEDEGKKSNFILHFRLLSNVILDDESQSPKFPIDGSNTSSESEEERPTMSSMAGFRTSANASTKGKGKRT